MLAWTKLIAEVTPEDRARSIREYAQQSQDGQAEPIIFAIMFVLLLLMSAAIYKNIKG